jgi:hypothetical protein
VGTLVVRVTDGLDEFLTGLGTFGWVV